MKGRAVDGNGGSIASEGASAATMRSRNGRGDLGKGERTEFKALTDRIVSGWDSNLQMIGNDAVVRPIETFAVVVRRDRRLQTSQRAWIAGCAGSYREKADGDCSWKWAMRAAQDSQIAKLSVMSCLNQQLVCVERRSRLRSR